MKRILLLLALSVVSAIARADMLKTEEAAQNFAKQFLNDTSNTWLVEKIYWFHKHPDSANAAAFWKNFDEELMPIGLKEALRENIPFNESFEFARFFTKCVKDYSEE